MSIGGDFVSRGFAKQIKEGLGGAGKCPAAAMNDAERAAQWFFERDGAETALGNFVPQDRRRQQADGVAEAERLLHALDIVEAHDGADADALLAKESLDVAADREVLVETDELNAGKVVGTN